MARFTVGFVFVVMFLNLLAVRDCGAEPTSKPADDAWPLYSKAAERVEEGYRAKIMSPTASNLDYQNFPPFPPEWYKYEKETYAFNAPARALLREARSRSVAHWPVIGEGVDAKLPYLDGCRALANEVADAALYEHLQGNDAAAIETVRDELHLAELLDAPPPPWMVVSFVAIGIQMSAITRLEIITAEVSLTEDATDSKRLQVQEKMTAEIAGCLNSVLKPFGVGVVVEGAHECMTTRGVHKSDVTMLTSCMLGTFRTRPETRQEFLSAINLK